MFKKLKDKITDEVKNSPQRIQQFTQSVTDKLQNTTSNDENFFTITEDEATPVTPQKLDGGGFTNVSLHSSADNRPQRRNSNTSILSDVSFLPKYEPANNSYVLYSDLEASASEFEDNASTASSSFNSNVSKEQIHLAFQKAQMRYHKYRGRYTDLAKHYKDLERDNAKLKSVLVETQDKAIRRVNELKEQCTLSQRAKADLEHSLRNDIDEKLIVIKTLKEKVELLQEQQHGVVGGENVNDKLQELKANMIVQQTEHKSIINALETSLNEYAEREKHFANTKRDLHAELQAKDADILALRKEVELGKDVNQLKAHNAKLADRCDTLSTKCHELEADQLKMEQYRLEIEQLRDERVTLKKQLDDAKYAFEAQKTEEFKAIQEETRQKLIGLESRIRNELDKEYKLGEENLRADFEAKLSEIRADSTDSSKELQIKLVAANDDLKIATQTRNVLTTELEQRKMAYNDLETNYLALINENAQHMKNANDLGAELAAVSRHIDEIHRTHNNELASLRNQLQAGMEERDMLVSQSNEANFNLQRQLDCVQNELCESRKHSDEISTLRADNDRLINEKQATLDELAKCTKNFSEVQAENSNLKLQLDAVSKTNDSLNGKLDELQQVNVALKQRESELSTMLDNVKTKVAAISESNANFTAQFDSVTETNHSLSNKLDGLEKSNIRLKQREGELTTMLGEVKEELNTVTAENSNLKVQFDKLTETNSMLSGKLDALQNDNAALKQRESELEHIKAELISITDENAKLKLEANTLREATATLTAKLEELQHCNLALKQQEGELERIKAELTIVTTQNSNLQLEVDTLNETNLTLNSKIKELQQHESELENIKAENSKLNLEVDALNGKIKELQCNNVAAMQDESSQLNNIKTENSKLKLEIGTLNDTNRTLDGKIKQLDSDNIALKQHESELEAKLGECNANFSAQLDSTRAAHEKQLTEVQRQLNTKLDVINELKDVNNNLKVQCDQVQSEFDAVRNELEQFKATANDNKKLNEDLSSSLQRESELSMKLNEITMERNEAEMKLRQYEAEIQQIVTLNAKVINCETRINSLQQEICDRDALLAGNLSTIKSLQDELSTQQTNNSTLSDENANLRTRIDNVDDANHDRLVDVTKKYEITMEENRTLKSSIDDVQTKLHSLQLDNNALRSEFNELEKNFADLQHDKQLLLDEVDELKTSPLNNNEMDALRRKLDDYKNIDASNRSSIEFYEGELQKMRNKNEKLNRKLDETLVTLNHCADLTQASTEVEYLRNVLYNYMLGKESLTMARVITAVCKFDRQQTEAIMKHEQHKQTLLGQLGIL